MKIRFLLVCGFLVFGSAAAHAASVLDIGTDYRLRGISYSRADYGQNPGQNYTFFSQRATAHVGGRFAPNIEMMTQFQAIGIAGASSGTITNPIIDPTNGRYPNENFNPFLQWAYLKATNLYDTPIDLTIGKQPIILGDGFLLSDDDLGFTGIRMQSRLPWYGLQSDAFALRTADSLNGNANNTVYGVQITKPAHAIRYQLTALVEQNNAGTENYVRPSENISSSTLATGAYNANHISKAFYDFRVEGRLLQGGFYKGEFAIQNGTINRTTSTVSLGGYAFLISAGLFSHLSKYGPIEIHTTFGQASGDSGGSTDDSFRPDYGHRFDGLERSGFGEFYGSTLYDAIGSTSNPHGLPPGFSGIRVVGAGVTTHPTPLLSVGIDYFVFWAMETAGGNFTASSTDSLLGKELDFGLGFAYTSYLSFRGSVALFSPGGAYQFQDNASRILLEAIGRF